MLELVLIHSDPFTAHVHKDGQEKHVKLTSTNAKVGIVKTLLVVSILLDPTNVHVKTASLENIVLTRMNVHPPNVNMADCV